MGSGQNLGGLLRLCESECCIRAYEYEIAKYFFNILVVNFVAYVVAAKFFSITDPSCFG